ncbi:MAG TPA: MBL fold metallo-hydrolase [Rhodanobacteraceae bacterium]|nr:MBL fold metallo-hydrolase [Rhodanobacteraceae bacterium]
MTIRFTSLGSGSRGNATLICAGDTRVLLDCGLGITTVRRQLAARGVAPKALDAVIVTHEHADHLGGVAALVRHFHTPVWLTVGTRERWRDAPDDAVIQLINPHTAFAIGALQIQPFPVPHDAREPCQFVFSDGNRRLGVLSDAGAVTPHMRDQLDGCDALMLEFNHDAHLLQEGPYPAALKRRVGGGQGHLSNAQAAALLTHTDCSHLQHLVAIHLSEKNNRPELAVQAAATALGCATDWMACATQAQGLDWREVR